MADQSLMLQCGYSGNTYLMEVGCDDDDGGGKQHAVVTALPASMGGRTMGRRKCRFGELSTAITMS